MRKLQGFLTGMLMCICLTMTMTVSAGAATRFPDVPKAHWAAASVTQAAELQLMNGKKNGTFGMGKPMTRAGFAVALTRLFGWETIKPAAGSFTDNQDQDQWYYAAVETASRNGAIPQQESAFRPNDPITREEMAVMLVRALGYAPISGLAQDLLFPFQDVESNVGYLVMAYELGLMKGKSGVAFEPEKVTTREQAATVLVRVYDRLHAATPKVCGIARTADDLNLSGVDTVAVPAAKLISHGEVQLVNDLPEEKTSAVFDAASEKKRLMQVYGTNIGFGETDLKALAEQITEQVEKMDWDGVLLDIRKLKESEKKGYSALTCALRKELGKDQLLYVTAEAPSWQGKPAYNGYDFAVLAAQADQVIIRVSSYSKFASDFYTAPQEPLEEIYYALATIRGAVPKDKLSLWITSTGAAWKGTSVSADVTAEEIHGLLQTSGVIDYWSCRYGSAYLNQTKGGSRVVVWYNDGRAAHARRQLLNFFGGNAFCISDLSGSLDETDGLLTGLTA